MKKILEVIFIGLFTFVYSGIEKDFDEKIIYIDPGHGGMDSGCVGIDGTLEKSVNLIISLKLKDYLTVLGYEVEMTRIGDYDLASENSNNRKKEDLLKRCEILNTGYLYVSIHANSYPLESCKGAQTFYASEEGKILATFIQDKIINTLNNTNREAQHIKDKYLIDNTKSVGCIVELGFLSNLEELNLLKNDKYQNNMAMAIALGINDYIMNNKEI